MWIVGYILYILLNVVVFVRILVKDTVDYGVYAFCCGALCIARLGLHGYTDRKGKTEALYVVTDGKFKSKYM